jgi:hypothetical protein
MKTNASLQGTVALQAETIARLSADATAATKDKERTA